MSIELSTDGAVATITINRPEKKNALILSMRSALADACDQINADPAIRAVVITGAGTDFCSGADVTEMGGGGINGSFYRVRLMAKMIRSLARIQKPVIAAVRGVSVGAGWSIALACDVIIASETARFCQIFKKIALAPDAGAVWFLTRYLGIAKAKELVYSARFVSAQEALEMGLVTRVVTDDQLLAEAHALAREYAAAPTIALGIAKRMFDVASTTTLDEFLDHEASMQPLVVTSSDFKEGASAFKEKRQAQFTGN
jgi:2-(1,2-epoxy-1,2-dihydrophenyl)acetyl-CoA isomerase